MSVPVGGTSGSSYFPGMSWGPCVRRMGDLLYHAMNQGPADHESRLLYGTSLVSVARLKKTQGMFAIIKLRVRGALVKLIFGVLESQMKTQHIPRIFHALSVTVA